MFQNDACKVLTGKVRLSYCHLTEPRATAPGSTEEKYSATLLIPKTDTATKAQLDAAMQAAVQEGTVTKWNNAVPPVIKYPLYDGDGVRQSGEPFGEECKGHWVINASSRQKPQVIDLSGSEVLPSGIYSGMYARVTIRFFAFSNQGNKGIGCGLNNVLKVEDGEPLGGRASAMDDFGDVIAQSGPAPVVPPAAVPIYTPPAGNPVYGPPLQQPAYTPPVDPITGMPLI